MTEPAAIVAHDADALAARAQAVFSRVRRERMAGLPFVNDALGVELVGLRRWRGLWLGVLVTPWFMNLLLLPDDGARAGGEAPQARWPRLAVGDSVRFAFPAGVFEFIAGREGELGEYLACSLFSPMFDFADHEAARQTAQACLVALFDAGASAPAESPQRPPPAPGAAVSAGKRDFLRGRWRSADAPPAGGER